MNIVIFAGGAGTRLWPISRQKSPKQFEKLKDNASTLQMAVNRIKTFGTENLYISTNEQYAAIVADQVPEIGHDQVFLEPARRDLAAAVLLTLLRLQKRGVHGTIAMLWSDHFMDREDQFIDALKKGESLLSKESNHFVFLGEKPRFANHNLGWIEIGDKISDGVHEFKSWKYRPEIEACKKMFESGKWLWNPGYFLFDIDFVLRLYQTHQPEMFSTLSELMKDEHRLREEYKNLPSMSFDNAIVEKADPHEAVVLPVDMGWSDPGTLYALKEALTASMEENYTKGNVLAYETRDSFVFNEEENKLVTTIGLDGIMVINTKDALLVCPKERVPEIKELLKRMEGDGLEKYL